MGAGGHFHEDQTRISERADEIARSEATMGSGWLAFAGAYLFIAGSLTVIWGIVALANKSYFTADDLVWSTLTTWGWAAIILGSLQMLAAGLIVTQRTAGRWLGALMAIAGIFLTFLSAGAYPLWSVIALVANSIVLWVVTVHGREFE